MATIQVRNSANLNSTTYVRADTLNIINGSTLLVDSTPAIRPGTIQCITSGTFRIENYTQIPILYDLDDQNHDFRFEAGGKFIVDGLPIEIGQGTGGAITFDFNTMLGGTFAGVRHCTYAEVETATGSGVYLPWPILDEDPANGTTSTASTSYGTADISIFTGGGEAGKALFWHETNRTLRCGNNTQGVAIPNGCKVRVPNIYISNRLRTNASRSMNIATAGTPTSGKFNLEIRNEAGVLLGTTADIAFNATAADIDTAIEAITGAGTVTSAAGPLPTAVGITWAGSLATGFGNFPSVTVVNSTLSGGIGPVAVVGEISAGNLSLVDVSPTGTLDFKWASFSHKIRLILDSFTGVKIRSCGFGADCIQFNNSNGYVDIEGLQQSGSPWLASNNLQLYNIYGQVRCKRMAGMTKGANFRLNLQVLPMILDVEDLNFGFYGDRNSSNNKSIQFHSLRAGTILKNVASIGAGIALVNCEGFKFINPKYADGVRDTQISTYAMNALNLTNSPNTLISNYKLGGESCFRNGFLNCDAISGGLEWYGGGITIDLKNNGDKAVYLSAAGAKVQDYKFQNVRTGPFINTISNYLTNSGILKKIFATYATQPSKNTGLMASTGGQYDLVSQNIDKMHVTFSGATDYVGGNFASMSLTPTTGHVTFGPFGSGEGLELTGSAYVDALGGIFLPTAGDSFTATIPFPMHGITGFNNVAPYLYIDAEGVIANVSIVISAGSPTGGTFNLTVYNDVGALLGTTANLAFNSNSVAVQTAIQTLLGGAYATVGGSLSGGYTINAAGIYLTKGIAITVDGSLLTGGVTPGIAYAYGRARLQTGTELLGTLVTAEFSVRVPSNDWPVLTALTGANLASAIPGLTGYSAGGSGLEMKVKVTALTTNPYTKFNMISLPTNIDPALWVLGDAFIKLNGPASTDVTRAYRASDDVELYAFTGSGVKELAVGDNFLTEVYFRRENASGRVLMTTYPQTIALNFGYIGEVHLYYGDQIQVAQNTDSALVMGNLDLIPLSLTKLDALASSIEDVGDLVAAM